jgi:glutathione peroxidase
LTKQQYSGLEEIYREYKDKGFEVLAFPCNDFGGQEPGTNEEIKQFAKSNFDVTFPMFDKLKALDPNQHKLYEYLTGATEPKGNITWNFEKFLVDKQGNVVKRYSPRVAPGETVEDIESELAK